MKIIRQYCKIQLFNHSLMLSIISREKTGINMCINFLDLTLILKSNIYKPYKKPNSSVSYTSKHRNHIQSIIKNLPKGINYRLNINSKNEGVFNQASPTYNNALKRSKFDHYNDDIKSAHINKENKSKRRRKITWFNPPFNMNVKTNVARNFLNLIDKHFPKTNKLHKIINRNTIKVSYSCLPNVKQMITNHNKHRDTATREETPKNVKLYNCREKASCPLNGKCLEKNKESIKLYSTH